MLHFVWAVSLMGGVGDLFYTSKLTFTRQPTWTFQGNERKGITTFITSRHIKEHRKQLKYENKMKSCKKKRSAVFSYIGKTHCTFKSKSPQ